MDNLLQGIAAEAGIIQKEIGDKVYTLNLLPASMGLEVFQRLIMLIGPSAGNFVDNIRNEEITMPEDDKMFTQAIHLLVERLMQFDLVETVKAFISYIKCEGSSINFDEHFRGNYGELFILVEWTLKENFSDAFTFWLKEKGLSIPTLSSLISKKDHSSQESSSESEQTAS